MNRVSELCNPLQRVILQRARLGAGAVLGRPLSVHAMTEGIQRHMQSTMSAQHNCRLSLGAAVTAWQLLQQNPAARVSSFARQIALEAFAGLSASCTSTP